MRQRILGVGLLIVLLVVGALLVVGLGQKAPVTAPWQAQWIWNSERHPNNFMLVRKSFGLTEQPAHAILKITAQDRYVAYINGAYVGRGPARSGTNPKSFDELEVSRFLHPGRNTVALIGYHYGTANNYGRDEPPGLLAQVGTGNRIVVATDHTWRVTRGAAWRADVPLMNFRHGTIGFTEIFNGSVHVGWNLDSYDDSKWDSAKIVNGPWKVLEPRRTEYLVEQEVFPNEILGAAELLSFMNSAVENDVAQRFQAEVRFLLEHAKIIDRDAVLRHDGQYAEFQPHQFDPDNAAEGFRDPVLIIDFGRQIYGRPKLRIKTDGPGAYVDLAYSMILLNGRVMPTGASLRLADRYIAGTGGQEWEAFEPRTFRYLQIAVRNGPVKIDSVSIVEVSHPAPQVGSFSSSDPLLNKLWQACIDTTKLSMEDALVTDASQARRVFAGDGAHIVFGVLAGFGTPAISDWYFELMAHGVTKEGLLRLYYPGTESGKSLPYDFDSQSVSDTPFNIAQTTPVVVNTLWYQYETSGNVALLRRVYPALVKSAEWFAGHLAPNGLLEKLPHYNWLDWSEQDFTGQHLGTNALYYIMLRRMAAFARTLDMPVDAQRWEALAEQIGKAIRYEFWVEERGVFADSVTNGQRSQLATEIGNGMTVLFGIASPEQAKLVGAHIAAGDAGLVQSSPLYMFYPLEALFQLGHARDALRIMRERYRGMLEHQSNPTIWEGWYAFAWRNGKSFNPAMPSYVHTGGATAAWQLGRHILGVRPTSPGYKRVTIAPDLADLSRASGNVPTPHGLINVSWVRTDGEIKINVSIPNGVAAEFEVPPEYRGKVIVDGNRQSTDGRVRLRAGSNEITASISSRRTQVLDSAPPIGQRNPTK